MRVFSKVACIVLPASVVQGPVQPVPNDGLGNLPNSTVTLSSFSSVAVPNSFSSKPFTYESSHVMVPSELVSLGSFANAVTNVPVGHTSLAAHNVANVLQSTMSC